MSNRNLVIALVVIVLVLIGLYLSRAKSNDQATANTPPPPQGQTPPAAPAVADCTRNFSQEKLSAGVTDIKNKFVTLTVRGFGDIKIQLNDQDAPKSVQNFLNLVNAGFYDCLTFHRITDLTGDPANPGRIIQGGDPLGTGTGGPGYTVPAEIKLNHEKGAIAMARTSDQINPERASSGSQFYIAIDPLPFLDGAYTVFGKVVAGLDIAEKINAVSTDAAGMPDEKVIIEKATITSN